METILSYVGAGALGGLVVLLIGFVTLLFGKRHKTTDTKATVPLDITHEELEADEKAPEPMDDDTLLESLGDLHERADGKHPRHRRSG